IRGQSTRASDWTAFAFAGELTYADRVDAHEGPGMKSEIVPPAVLADQAAQHEPVCASEHAELMRARDEIAGLRLALASAQGERFATLDHLLEGCQILAHD